MSDKWFPYAAVAKFSVRSVLTEGYADHNGKPQISAVTVKLGPVYSDAADEQNENWKFTKATPQGEFWMRIENPDLFKTFEVGQTFYLPMVLADAINLADLSHSLQTLPRKGGMDSQ